MLHVIFWHGACYGSIWPCGQGSHSSRCVPQVAAADQALMAEETRQIVRRLAKQCHSHPAPRAHKPFAFSLKQIDQVPMCHAIMATMAQGTISRLGMARLTAAFEDRLHSAYSAAQLNTAGSPLVQLSHVDCDRPFDRKGSRFRPARGRVSASRHRFARTVARTHSIRLQARTCSRSGTFACDRNTHWWGTHIGEPVRAEP